MNERGQSEHILGQGQLSHTDMKGFYWLCWNIFSSEGSSSLDFAEVSNKTRLIRLFLTWAATHKVLAAAEFVRSYYVWQHVRSVTKVVAGTMKIE